MTNTYRVPVTYLFTGYFDIQAESAKEARQIAIQDCGLVMGGDIHTTDDEAVLDWEFAAHPNKQFGRIAIVTKGGRHVYIDKGHS